MKTTTEKEKEAIIGYTKTIHLPGIREQFEALAVQSAMDNESYEKYLLGLLEVENTIRQQNSRDNRIRQSGFPYKKYLEDLSLNDLPIDARHKLPLLERLDFIKTGQNVILNGNPGTGKTHLAIGLGIRACEHNYKVFYITTHSFITLLRESRSDKTLRALENKFARYDLLICDEFGYISYDKEGAELLFSHLSLRAGRKSVLITTNMSFDRWSEIFHDPVVTATMVDRLTHRAYMVNMNGESYRLKDTRKWVTEQKMN